MAFFGSQTSFVGIDIGTSSLKIVELINRRRRIELAAYAQAESTNYIIHPPDGDKQVIDFTARLIARMMEKAGVSSDQVIAALPSSVVFSTVLMMPDMPEGEMEKALMFAARDVVPADIDEMVIGWSRAAELPHMAAVSNAHTALKDTANPNNVHTQDKETVPKQSNTRPVPVFLTAAPRQIVERYVAIVKLLELELIALEVETFPLVRSLLVDQKRAALIIDIGDLSTTFHIIDGGIPRVSHSIDNGGEDITRALASAMSSSQSEADSAKSLFGLLPSAPAVQRSETERVVAKQIQKALDLIERYRSRGGGAVQRSILIGGGANLPGLQEFWRNTTGHETTVGNPWRGLSYPHELDIPLKGLGPTFSVAVGLALRNLT